MKRLAALTSIAAICGCFVEGEMPPVAAGPGVVVDPNTNQVAIDPGQVPLLPACAAGEVVRRGANGWECVRLEPNTQLAAGDGITIANDTLAVRFGSGTTDVARGDHAHDDRYQRRDEEIAWNRIDAETVPDFLLANERYSDDDARAAVAWNHVERTIPEGETWPGTIGASQVIGLPAPYSDVQARAAVTWNHVETIATGAAWPGTVPFAGVTGITATTPWAGTVPFARVSGIASSTPWAGTVPFANVTGITPTTPWAGTVPIANVSGIGASTEWPGTVPYARVTGAPAPYSDEEARAAVSWPDVGDSVTSTTPWPGTTEWTRVSNKPDVAALLARIEALEAASAAATDCPVGYARDTSATSITLCRNGPDEVVKVGTGASAFWIDRYEASTWTNRSAIAGAAAGTPYGVSGDDYPATFPDNGQWTAATSPVVAVSKAGVIPSRTITWFQAQAACEANGKRLPTRQEWFSAIRGTVDPGANDGALNAGCNTNSSTRRLTGGGTACASRWGAQDLIGNAWEWTDEWYAGVGNSHAANTWPAAYGSDITYNVGSSGLIGGTLTGGLPSAILRGGDLASGTGGGIHAVAMNHTPGSTAGDIGFRCVVPQAVVVRAADPAPRSCPDGWTDTGTFCYSPVQPAAPPHFADRDCARDFGGHLCSVGEYYVAGASNCSGNKCWSSASCDTGKAVWVSAEFAWGCEQWSAPYQYRCCKGR